MKGKNIILVGAGTIMGFVSCGVITIEKILESDRMREALKQVVLDKVCWILFVDTPRPNNQSKVSYRSYYDFKNHRPKTLDGYSNIYFPARADAEKVLDEMKDITDQYGYVTIADFYELAGVRNFVYNSSKYGWLDIDKCKIVRIKACFKIDLPDPLLID